METLTFEQALLEASKKKHEEKRHKELLKSLRPLVTPQPALNLANIQLIKESFKDTCTDSAILKDKYVI